MYSSSVNTSPLYFTEGLISYARVKEMTFVWPKKSSEATKILLRMPGFNTDEDDKSKRLYRGCHVSQIQGTPKLRIVAALISKYYLDALSPDALRLHKSVNLEQYLIFKIKRISHVFELSGSVTLPSGKNMLLEGFCEVFTIPMIASSFKESMKSLAIKLKKDHAWLFNLDQIDWIVKNFNSTTSSDMISEQDIDEIAHRLQDTHFVGPLSIGAGFDWHSIITIFFGDYLFYCNRGSGSNCPGILIYKLPDRSLITGQVIEKLAKRQDQTPDNYFDLNRIIKDLQATLVFHEPLPAQEVGNCTYTSAEAALVSMMALRYSLSHENENYPSVKALFSVPSRLSMVFYQVKSIYQRWKIDDRSMVLNDLLKDLGVVQENNLIANIYNYLFGMIIEKLKIDKNLVDPNTYEKSDCFYKKIK